MTKLGGPVKGLRPSDKLRPETDPAQEWLLIDPASRRLALSKHKDEAKILARTLCLDPRRTVKKEKKNKGHWSHLEVIWDHNSKKKCL